MMVPSQAGRSDQRSRRGLRLTMVFMLTLALVTLRFGAVTPPAEATPANGCGDSSWTGYLVPNSPFGYDFTQACNNHDDCYAAQLGKNHCDTEFYNEMMGVCNSMGNDIGCPWFAGLYFYEVFTNGDDAYNQAAIEKAYEDNLGGEDSNPPGIGDGSAPYGDGGGGTGSGWPGSDGGYGDGGSGGYGDGGGYGGDGGGSSGGGGSVDNCDEGDSDIDHAYFDECAPEAN